MSREAPHRLAGLRQDQQSQRIAGGSAALTNALVRTLAAEGMGLKDNLLHHLTY